MEVGIGLLTINAQVSGLVCKLFLNVSLLLTIHCNQLCKPKLISCRGRNIEEMETYLDVLFFLDKDKKALWCATSIASFVKNEGYD
jgi:hypothetical protein